MNPNNNPEQLKKEEQSILERLINRMDNEMLVLDDKLTMLILEAKKAKDQCLPDTYGMLVEAVTEIKVINQEIKRVQQSKDELYEHRIIVEIEDEDGTHEEQELKIGLHTYAHGKDIFVCSWLRPVCRYFTLDNTGEVFDSVVYGKYGEKYHTKYTLKMKRKVDLRFIKVKNVLHMFPILTEEGEKIIADEFLQELLSRRSGKEFKNIVFSIQKQQGEIIQTPFSQDIIVQGCAGSGKSMIMLHRLPILLFDNPNNLDKNNLYIITPSLAYIQMAENMRYQLEISDLKMGTLLQYYDYAIEKYGKSKNDYGKINTSINLSIEQEKYVYSEECISDIVNEIEIAIKNTEFDYETGLIEMGLKERDTKKGLPQEQLREIILQAKEIDNKNNSSLRGYYNAIRDALNEFEELRVILMNRRIAVLRGIALKKSESEAVISKAQNELEKLDQEKNKDAIGNRHKIIQVAEKRINELELVKTLVEEDTVYFTELDEVKQSLDKLLSIFTDFNYNYEEHARLKIYDFISLKDVIVNGYHSVFNKLTNFDDKYSEYASNIESQVRKLMKRVMTLQSWNPPLLTLEYYKQLLEKIDFMTYLDKNIVDRVYIELMKKISKEYDKKGKITALSCSPYIFLQVLYNYQGTPNAAKESLITIDEAQGLAPQEFTLIKKVNDNKVILNLFGDENQYIEGSKGIDKWNEVSDIANFKQYIILENYRNARQITEYCNHRFTMRMNAINLDGQGVHELHGFDNFKEEITTQFLNVQKQGLCAIIVKNVEEAKYIQKEFKTYEQKIHNMTVDSFNIHRTHWNLMSVEEAKGLEFGTVIAITGRMTQNEKYITYTRALDELYVFDEEMEFPEKVLYIDEKTEFKKDIKGGKYSKKNKIEEKKSTDDTIDYTNSVVKAYFEEVGLKVLDLRQSGGKLWVLGKKETLREYVNEAIGKFGISGAYGISLESGFKLGWYSKTKK